MRLYLVVNPRAKRASQRRALVSTLKRVLGASTHIRCSGSIDELEEMACECRQGEYEAVGICGGDGTVHHTLSAFEREYGDDNLPPVLLLNGGTTNTVSHSIGLRGRPEVIARRFRKAVEEDTLQTVSRSTMREGQRLCFVFGVGMITRFQHAVYAGSGQHGRWSAAGVILHTMASTAVGGPFSRDLFSLWKGTLQVDGTQLPHGSYTAVLAQTIENLALGFRPMYRALERPGTFHVIAGCMSGGEVLRKIPHLFWGKPIEGKGTYDDICAEIRLVPKGESEYSMDGDLYPMTEALVLRAGPEIRFFQI